MAPLPGSTSTPSESIESGTVSLRQKRHKRPRYDKRHPALDVCRRVLPPVAMLAQIGGQIGARTPCAWWYSVLYCHQTGEGDGHDQLQVVHRASGDLEG